MNSTRVAVLLLLSFSACLPSRWSVAQSAPSPESQIKHILSAQEVAWNVGDSTSWGSAFTEDADFINVLGQAFHGRETIVQLRAREFAGAFKGSHATVTVRQFRQLTPDVVMVEAVHEVTGYKTLPPGIVPTTPGMLRTRMKYVLIKREEAWQIVAAQNTAVLPETSSP
jgi:uncharacterized protein (TIGR02246 family)